MNLEMILDENSSDLKSDIFLNTRNRKLKDRKSS